MPHLNALSTRIAAFAAAREWDQFHSPRNLAAALSVEAGELLEHFQWLTNEQSASLSPDKLKSVESEMADVFIYLLFLANKLDVDLVDAANRKMDVNASKYPVDLARGNATKSTDFES